MNRRRNLAPLWTPSRSRHQSLRPTVMPLEPRRLLAGATVDEFPVPLPNSFPQDLVKGPDGNLWFTDDNGVLVDRITPGGQVTAFPLPTASNSATPYFGSVVVGPGGDLWFLDENNTQVDRVTPAGQVTQYALPGGPVAVQSLVAGSDGNLWFNINPASGNATPAGIGRLTVDGQVTEYPFANPASRASSLTLASDGNVWFLDTGAGELGHITPAGVIAEQAAPTPSNSLVAASDGALWYFSSTSAASTSDNLVRLVPGGQPQTFPVAGNIVFLASDESSLTAASDGSVWFLTEPSSYDTSLVRVTATGQTTSTAAEDVAQQPLVAGPNGSIDFLSGLYTAVGRQAVGQITAAGVVTTTLVPNGVSIGALTLGPDDNLYFLDYRDSLVGRVDVVPTAAVGPTLVGAAVAPSFPVGTPTTGTLADIRYTAGITITATTIDWGDGTAPTAGTVTSEGLTTSQQFETDQIAGSHTYATVGSYTATVTATGTDASGNPVSLAIPVGIFVVNPAPVPQANPTLNEAAGVTFSGFPIAGFTTPTPHGSSGSDFTATIDWGDGSAPTTGVVSYQQDDLIDEPSTAPVVIPQVVPTPPADSQAFYVTGGHTYAVAGDYTIHVTLTDNLGNSATGQTAAHIVANPIFTTPPTQPVVTTAGSSTTPLVFGNLYGFRKGGSAPAETVTVDWGDGSTPTTASTRLINVVGFYNQIFSTQVSELIGDHTYAAAGTYTITYTVTDADGNTATGTTPAQVTPVVISPPPPPSNPLAASFTGADLTTVAVGNTTAGLDLAVLEDANTATTAGELAATVNWGDGTAPTSATLTPTGTPGQFTIAADHRFAAAGSYSVVIEVTAPTGSPLLIPTTITAEAPHIQAATATETGVLLVGSGAQANGFPLGLATFAAREPNTTAGDFAATIHWGDGTAATVATIEAQGASADGVSNYSVLGGHRYALPGTYTVSITVAGADGTAFTMTNTVRAAAAPVVGPQPLVATSSTSASQTRHVPATVHARHAVAAAIPTTTTARVAHQAKTKAHARVAAQQVHRATTTGKRHPAGPQSLAATRR